MAASILRRVSTNPASGDDADKSGVVVPKSPDVNTIKTQVSPTTLDCSSSRNDSVLSSTSSLSSYDDQEQDGFSVCDGKGQQAKKKSAASIVKRRRSSAASVSFGSVQVRHHARILGDHPSCCDDLPLGLDWERVGQDVTTLIDLDDASSSSSSESSSFCASSPAEEQKGCPQSLSQQETESQNKQHAQCNIICDGRFQNHDCHEKRTHTNPMHIGEGDGRGEQRVDNNGSTTTIEETNNGEGRFSKIVQHKEQKTYKFARAKRLSYEERRELLLHNTQHCLRTRSSIRRSDSRRIRQNAIKSVLLSQQQPTKSESMARETRNTKGANDGENVNSCFLNLFGLPNLLRSSTIKSKVEWAQ